MRAFKVFIFGLLYGWFIKIAFDRIYRDNEFEDIRNENTSLRDYIRSLEERLEPKSLETKSMQSMQPMSSLSDEPLFSPPAPLPIDLPNAIPTQQAPAEPFDVPTQAPTEPAPLPREEMAMPSLGASEGDRDDLKIIKGIGPAIERKLNNAGIYTFAALSKMNKKQLEEVLGSQIRRLQDENDLLAQARQLARRR